MIDVKHKTCIHEGCHTRPTYDEPGGSGISCKKHKGSTMIDISHKICEYEDCTIRASFGLPGTKHLTYCSKHKEPNMINNSTKTCLIDECKTTAHYGRPGHPRSHCAKHREPGMIRRPNGKCKQPSCTEKAIYGGTNFTPIHCESHKEEDELNLVERICIKCGLTMILDKTECCEFCNPESFKRIALAKQNAMLEYLDSRKDLPKPLSTDTIIDNGTCGKERPDRIYDLEDKIIIVECDEDQHRYRPCECEQTRMVNIGQSFGGLLVLFLRWNPDDYSPENPRKQPEPLTKRNKLLADLIRDISNNKVKLPNALVSTIQLYFDEWDGLEKQEWQILTPIDSGSA
jgi:hypothetical protein